MSNTKNGNTVRQYRIDYLKRVNDVKFRWQLGVFLVKKEKEDVKWCDYYGVVGDWIGARGGCHDKSKLLIFYCCMRKVRFLNESALS